MNSQRWLVFVLLALLVVGGIFSVRLTQAQDPTPTPRGGIFIEPVNPRPSPTPFPSTPVPNTGGSIFDGRPAPAFEVPPTYEELIAAYPKLADYAASIADQLPADLDFAELYTQILQIYADEGASGLAIFLENSGLLEKLGLPLSYLDLLTVYDSAGLEGVEALAQERGILNRNNELVGYLTVDSRDNLASLTTELEALGVAVYRYSANRGEVEVGVSLDILAQYGTPDAILNYLVLIANLPHVEGWRIPTPKNVDGLSMERARQTSLGGDFIGLDAWQAAGITGRGVKVGILDMGFANVLDVLGDELPQNVVSNLPLDEMQFQDTDHGTACAMIVHAAAPDAELYLAYFDGSSDSSFRDAVQFLLDNDVDIINYSVGSAVSPGDGTGEEALFIADFVRQNDVLWVNAAGNFGNSHARFQFNPDSDGVHFFEDGDPTIPFAAFAPYTVIVLKWDGNWQGGEENNYGFLVLDEDGYEVGFAGEPRRGKRNDFPVQGLVLETNPGQIYYLVALQEFPGINHTLDIFFYDSEIAPWRQSPLYSLATPADSKAVLSVGATALQVDKLEDYSSQGPTTDGRIKPDLSAPTGEPLPGYPEGFFGTSGSAPLVAGAAALVKQLYPQMSYAELKAYLMANIVDLGAAGEDPSFGEGRLALSTDDLGMGVAEGGEAQPTPEGDNVVIIGGGEPSAEVTNYNVQFNIPREGELGMGVSLSFEVQNLRGATLGALLVFFDGNGNAVPPSDSAYDVLGTLGVAETFVVSQSSAQYRDFLLFFPNTAFGFQPEGTQLYYQVGLVDLSDSNNPRLLWSSEPDYIVFRSR
jgi:subtilisin family serine protease